MSDSDSDISHGDTVTHTGKWPISRIKLLIKLRLEMETQFRSGRSRHLLWPQIYNKMKSTDPSMTETLKNVQKKFNNLMLTYKRIKSTARTNHPSKWEFFEDFDESLAQFSETQEDDDQSNVRYIKVEKLNDDDSVSFSSDDCDTRPVRPVYNSVMASKPEPRPVPRQETHITSTIAYDNQAANGIKSERSVENVQEVKKRKLIETGQCTSLKKTKTPSAEPSDDNAWFKEYVKLNERKEQLRHDSLMEMEKKKLEIETKKMQMLREFIDVMKKFVNK